MARVDLWRPWGSILAMTVATTYSTGAHQLWWDIKRHPATDMLRGGPTDKPGKNACRYHRRVNWKRHTQSWNLTLIDETGSVFSNHTSKPLIARSQFRCAISIPALVGVVAAAAVSIKGVIVGRWGRGSGRIIRKFSGGPYGDRGVPAYNGVWGRAWTTGARPPPPVIRALGRGQLASALSRRRRRPHFVVTICQCEPSACFTREVRLLLIIITLRIGADRIRRYVSAVNGLSV